jgi:CRISPR-associated endonuclease Csn1
MAYRLALDIGANSIGWCLFALDPSGSPCAIRAIGVRIFPDGRDPKTNASLAANRRQARAMRRRRDRYLQRRRAMLSALTRHGLMPADAAERAEIAKRDPYALRAKALRERLEPYDLGRIIFHLNQRRGFRSNRKTDRGNEERGKIADAAERLKAELARGGHVTLGSWFAERHAGRHPVRARLHGAGAKAAYPFYPTRDLIEAEFDTIWSAQSAWNPALTPAIGAELRRILSFQRDLRAPPVGRCWLEPGEARAPRALPSTQAFRIAQDLAHLAIRRVGEPDQPLTQQQREVLAAQLNAGRDLSFNQIRRQLGLTRGESFNLESRARDELKGAETAVRLAARKKPLYGIWADLDLDARDAVVTALLEAQTEQEAVAKLVSLGIPQNLAEEAEKIALPDGHASLSTKAIRQILPHLQAGMTYSAAVQAAGYAHHSDDRDGVILPALPYYGEVLGERIGTGSGKPEDPPEKRYGRLPNPTVHVALNQVRQVVNALIKQYGHPSEIVVEVLRELAHSAKQRAEIEKEQKANKDRRDRWAKELAGLGLPVNGRNMAFMRLWEEQADDPKERVCPYSGERISIERLFSGQIEEDHILPFAITLDDSFNNRVLVTREANRRKARRTPFEAFHDSPDWPDIQARAKLLPPAKAWRFARDALERWQGEHADFLARHLTDSAYIARLARPYLRTICDDRRIWFVPGRLTALLRQSLGLNSASLLGKGGARKERTDHRHHAIDALTVGLIDRSLLQRVATAARRGQESGRLMEKLDAPWPGFIDDAAKAVNGIVVSCKPDTAASGKLHNDTAYGRVPNADGSGPNVAHHVPVQSLAGWTEADVAGAIADGALRRRIAAALAAGEKPAQAAALARIEHGPDAFVRRVQVRERLDGTAEIRDRRTGKGYKWVKLDANHRAEFWRLPPNGGQPGKVVMIVVPMLHAAADAEARRLGRPVPDRRPHPAATLLMRLHKNDILALGSGTGRQLCRVVKFSNRQLTLAACHEGGNLKARDADGGDPFRYISAGVKRLGEKGARKVWVDAIGRVRDPGPLAW